MTDPADLELARALAERLRTVLGPEVLDVRLIGSRARGDHRPDSDLDVFVLVSQPDRALRHAVCDVATDLNEETSYQVFVAPLVMDREEFAKLVERERRLALDVLREGVPL